MKLLKILRAFYFILQSDQFFVASVKNQMLRTNSNMDLETFKEVTTNVIHFAEIPQSVENEIKELLTK